MRERVREGFDDRTSRASGRRLRLWRPVAGTLVLCAAAAALHGPLLARLATWLHDADEPQPADVVVVLGTGSGYRVAKAADLCAQGVATRMAITAPDAEYPQWETPPGERWIWLAVKRGVPRGSIDVLTPSETLVEDAALLDDYFSRHGYDTALIVTDPYLTRRTGWILRRELGSAREVRLVDCDLREYAPRRWWRDESQVKQVVLEYVRLAHHALVYGLRGPIARSRRSGGGVRR